MSKNVLTLIKKELVRFFTDRRMVFSLILPGLIIFVLYSVMGNFMGEMTSVDPDYEYQIYIVNQPSELEGFNHSEALNFNITYLDQEDDTLLDDIENQDVDLYLIYQDNFYADMLAYQTGDGLAPEIDMYYNSAKTESSSAYNYYRTVLNQYESNLSNKFDINRDTETQYDMATEDDVTMLIITSILPFLLMTFLFSGAMTISTESIAGEKERGTIATLLMTPTKRSEIALGKIISLSIITLVSATSSFLGVMLSLPRLLGQSSFSVSMYGFGTYALLFVVIISTVLIYVVLLSIVSAYAKSVKEAASLAAPFMILNMLVGISSMLGVSSSSVISYMIPLYNSVQSITSILSLAVVPLHLGVTIFVNLIIVTIGVWILAKMFNSEKVMFNK